MLTNLSSTVSLNRCTDSRALPGLDLGDVCAPRRSGASDSSWPASTTFAQLWARRCSGAFAAELLLPSEHLFERFGVLDSAASHDVFLSLLNEYGVGARTAAFQLWNRGLLSSPRVRDGLIDDFSNVER